MHASEEDRVLFSEDRSSGVDKKMEASAGSQYLMWRQQDFRYLVQSDRFERPGFHLAVFGFRDFAGFE